MTNGERVKYLREKKGLIQKDVATRLGLEPATISKYELDMREPNIEAYYTQLHLPQKLLTAGEYIDIMSRL